jgi:hypothetical protein
MRLLATGLGGIATAAGMVAVASWTSAWMVTLALSGHPNGPFAEPKPGLRALALVESAPVLFSPVQMAKVIEVPVAEKPVVADSTEAAPAVVRSAPKVAAIPAAEHPIAVATLPLPAPLPPEAFTAKPMWPVQETAAANPIPLPLARPRIEVARAPEPAKPQVVASAIPEQMALPKQAALPPVTRMSVLPPPGSRIALYDISGHTVYLPDGRRLEAHSGVGERMDDPRYIRVRMHGPTPPNIYRLSLREQLFHGVQAIRLTPTDESKMFGRDGMLAHTFMLGPTGQSNGCVSFRNYNAFLQAYRNGEVDRMVVVPHLSEAPARIAEAMRSRVATAE